MKRIFYLTLLLMVLLFTNTQAQHKLQFGLNIGGGLGIQSIDNSSVIDNNAIRTFNAEAIVNIPILHDYFIRTGIGFENKGTQIQEDALTTINKLRYIQIPATIIRKFEIPTLGKLIGGAGGYFAQGLSGSIHYETPSAENFNKVAFGDDADFQRYDSGLRFIAGLELNNRLTFNLGYDLGLYNIASQTSKDAGYNSIYNRQFSITLGLVF